MQKPLRPARVSIVIPLQRDEKRFEATTLSVLENRPEDSQIIAVHNGTYADPFELGDELTFVTARSSNLVDLIRDAFAATTAPVVHVLGTGMKATDGWMGEAVQRFDDHQVAAVAPTLIDESHEDARPASWADTPGRLCQPHVSSSGVSESTVGGFFLNAFAIRRRLLGELLEAVAPAMNDPVAVSYAFGCMLHQAGWKTEVCRDCEIVDTEALSLGDESDLARGQCLGAIRSRILPTSATPGLGVMLHSAFFGNSSLGEMLGLLRHRSGLAAMRRAIDPETVSSAEALSRVLELDSRQSVFNRAA